MLVGTHLLENEYWMGEMATGTILSGGTLRRGVAVAVAAALFGTAVPAFALPHAPTLVPQASMIHQVVWRWNGYRWVWVPGPRYYPRPRAHWIPGHWVWGPYGRHWIPGHWA